MSPIYLLCTATYVIISFIGFCSLWFFIWVVGAGGGVAMGVFIVNALVPPNFSLATSNATATAFRNKRN